MTHLPLNFRLQILPPVSSPPFSSILSVTYINKEIVTG